MAWTYMNNTQGSYWVLPTESYTTPAEAVWGFVSGIVETTDAGTFIVVEAYSGSAAGTKRRVPTGGSEDTLQNATFLVGGDFGWQTGTLAAGDWIVLESTGTNPFQVYIEYDSGTSINWALIPLGDFTTGGTEVTPPNGQGFSATSFGTAAGTSPTLVSQTVPAGTCSYSVLTTDSLLIVVADNGTASARTIMYAGAVDSHPDDTRPYILKRLPGTFGEEGVVPYSRLSFVDSTTNLQTGNQAVPYGNGYITASGYDGINGKYMLQRAQALFLSMGHYHTVFLKHCYYGSVDLSSSGTLDSNKYAYWCGSLTYARLAIDWDGVTDVP